MPERRQSNRFAPKEVDATPENRRLDEIEALFEELSDLFVSSRLVMSNVLAAYPNVVAAARRRGERQRAVEAASAAEQAAIVNEATEIQKAAAEKARGEGRLPHEVNSIAGEAFEAHLREKGLRANGR